MDTLSTTNTVIRTIARFKYARNSYSIPNPRASRVGMLRIVPLMRSDFSSGDNRH